MTTAPEPDGPRPCPAPADFLAAVAEYDARAVVGRWDGPRYRMSYRMIGEGPPLVLAPGIAGTYSNYALLLNSLAGRFRTILYDYPGDHPGDDGARLGRIGHEDLVDDLFGLLDHLNVGRVYPVGVSFGSTVVLAALARESRRFPMAAVQGGFARRAFTPAERLGLLLGRRFPGTIGRLPLHDRVLTWNNKVHFPDLIADRWAYYLRQNACTPIAGMAHRLDLMARLDLRPRLGSIGCEVLVLQGNEDRIVPRPYFDELVGLLPKARGLVLPMVGHQVHYTHAEAMAQALADSFLPCAPGGCPSGGPPPA